MEVIPKSACPPFVAPDNAIIRERRAPRNSSVRHRSLAEAAIPPGSFVREHCHVRTEEPHPIVSGRGLMRVDGEERAVGPGDTVVIRPGQRHRIATLGDAPLVMLVPCAPGYEAEDQLMTE
ncbi:MAG TPA: cupin domain-containing protein [Verrucomicrobiota bacterium]|nr:cupin domain-containing protein [Verrucomicrobiota bacterium]